MSRIGKQPITIPTGVTVAIDTDTVKVTGPKGELTLKVPFKVKAEVRDGVVYVERVSNDPKIRANHGSTRAHINNMIQGVQNHWKKELEIRGTGYKAQLLDGNKLRVIAGYIHPVDIVAPEGIQFQVAQDTIITVTGADKIVVGQVASNIRKIKKPEPYKGKGIRYVGEFIKLKAGKKAKA